LGRHLEKLDTLNHFEVENYCNLLLYRQRQFLKNLMFLVVFDKVESDVTEVVSNSLSQVYGKTLHFAELFRKFILLLVLVEGHTAKGPFSREGKEVSDKN
jgi:hypothetical protein